MMKALCIGGKADGEWVEIPEHGPDRVFVEPLSRREDFYINKVVSAQEAIIRYTYERYMLQVDGAKVVFLTPPEQTFLQTMSLLFDGYRKSR